MNYLVISLGDEDLSMDTAIKICELAYRYRDWDEAKDAHKNSKKLNIYVRSYCPESLYRLKKIESDINVLYAASGIKLYVFGDIQKVFTYENIVEELWLAQAKRYNAVYCKHEEGSHGYSVDELWGKTLGYLDLNKATDKLVPKEKFTSDIIYECERKMEQNICNSLHSKTKKCVLECCEPPCVNKVCEGKSDAVMSSIEKWYHAANGRIIREISSSEKINKLQSLYQSSVFGKSGSKFNITHEIYYAPSVCNEDKHGYITTVLLNIARLEHERWVAKSLLQGLMINPVDPCKKVSSRRYHTDLCAWDIIRGWDAKSSISTQGYDCLVVEVTLEYEKGMDES